MRRIVITALVLCLTGAAFAQTDTTTLPVRKVDRMADVSSNDHFMIQLGYTSWSGKPDSINTGGLPRTFNFYVMMNFPFRSNNHWSVAIGPGIATDNIYFNKTNVGIKDRTTTLHFTNVSDTNHFKKYKLATAYLEAPVELRYRFNPGNDANSVKIAVGAKIGLLVNAHVKGKTLVDKNGNALDNYIMKENSSQFFNNNRFSLTGRIGYGHFTVFTSYSVTPLFKEGLGPSVHPFTLGLTLSGL